MKKRRAAKSRSGHEALADIDHLVLRLDNGELASFDPVAETKVPRSPGALRKAAREAASRAEFWAYQAARARKDARLAELDMEEAEAKADLMQRAAFKGVGSYTERISESMVTLTEVPEAAVQSLRRKYAEMQEHADILKAVAQGAQNRVFLIQRLIGNDGDH